MCELDLLEVFYWGLQNLSQIEIIISSLNSLYFLLNYSKNYQLTSDDTNLIAEKMKKNGILKQLEKLQYESNKEIYERSYILIDNFFTTIDEEF